MVLVERDCQRTCSLKDGIFLSLFHSLLAINIKAMPYVCLINKTHLLMKITYTTQANARKRPITARTFTPEKTTLKKKAPAAGQNVDLTDTLRAE